MAFQHLNREQRRAMKAYAAELAKNRPTVLTEVRREDYPRGFTEQTHVWMSRRFLAQMFDAPIHEGRDTRRLSVNRVTLADSGRFEEGISWDELMQVKREIGFGDWYGLEVYPRDKDVVNVSNMRHLWLLGAPLSIGWFDGKVDP